MDERLRHRWRKLLLLRKTLRHRKWRAEKDPTDDVIGSVAIRLKAEIIAGQQHPNPGHFND